MRQQTPEIPHSETAADLAAGIGSADEQGPFHYLRVLFAADMAKRYIANGHNGAGKLASRKKCTEDRRARCIWSIEPKLYRA